MSVTGVFTKGKPVGHPAATTILRYIPRPRVPWQPSRFARANLDDVDLARLWARGRYRDGPGNFNSGYSTEKSHVMEDSTVEIIPKHELEKYMPDISIPGGKALVTPVSLMSARNGHRVTHDMIHSYDPYIGRLQKPAVVDHENISVEDPNRVGLNAATLDCRGRIYRWLRRGPFFQEDQYFRRSISLQRNGALPPESPHEAPLMEKIILLARSGKLKDACEAYRQVTSVPPVEVYRELIAACVPGGQLADAVAIFEDGNSKLFYVARDGEVLWNLMRCAVLAKHRVRVMWVWNVMCGRYYENVLVRAEIESLWRFRISLLALSFLLDSNAGEEAREIYRYMAYENLLDSDLSVRLGQAIGETLKDGKQMPDIVGLSASLIFQEISFTTPLTLKINSDEGTENGSNSTLSPPVIEPYESLALQQNARRMAPQVASAVFRYYVEQLHMAEEDGMEMGAVEQGAEHARSIWSRCKALAPPMLSAEQTSEDNTAAAVDWLEAVFPDVAVLSILRHARFKHGHQVDLLLHKEKRSEYLSRVVKWLHLLCVRASARHEAPLPYLRKSKPSLTNEKVRVVYPSLNSSNSSGLRRGYLLPSEEGYQWAYHPGLRLVEETFQHAGDKDSLQAKYLAHKPIHRDVPLSLNMLELARQREDAAQPLPSEKTNDGSLDAPASGVSPLDGKLLGGAVEVLSDNASSHRVGTHLLHASVWQMIGKKTSSFGIGGTPFNNPNAPAGGEGSSLLKSSTRSGSTPKLNDEHF